MKCVYSVQHSIDTSLTDWIVGSLEVYPISNIEKRPSLSIFLTHLGYFVLTAAGSLIAVYKSVPECIDDRFQPTVNMKLLKDVSNVVTGCSRADGK